MSFKYLATSNHRSFARKPLVFHAFSDHCFIVQLCMLKVTCFAQKCDFRPQFVPPVASKMRPAGHHFRQKGPQRWSPPNVPPTSRSLLKPTWARPAAQNAQGYLFIDSRVGFGVILGSILEQFGLDFRAI